MAIVCERLLLWVDASLNMSVSIIPCRQDGCFISKESQMNKYFIVAMLMLSPVIAFSEDEGEIHFSEQQADAVNLQTETVEPGEFSSAIGVSGYLQPATGASRSLVAATDGVVTLCPVAVGSEVRAGQAVAYLHTDVLAAGNPAVKAKAALDAAESQYNRAARLVLEGSVSQKAYEQARREYQVAKAEYEMYEKGNAKGIAITSPLSGTIGCIDVEDGAFVQAGTTVAVVTDINAMRLCAEVPVGLYPRLSKVTSARFRVPGSDRVYDISKMGGRLLSYGRSVKRGEAYLPVTFSLTNEGSLAGGMYAEVWLTEQPRTDVISVPLSALTEEQGLYFVYIRLDEDCYRKQEVSLGGNDGERVEVLSGLHSGDIVVTRGAYQVRLAAFSSSVPEGHSHHH